MKIRELFEQIGTVGSTGTPVAGATIPPTSSPTQSPNLSGNVQDLNDPKVQAATLAKMKQDKNQQKKAIQDQIKQLQQALQQAQLQATELNRTA